MLRNSASRLALRSLTTSTARPAANFTRTTPILQWTTQFSSLALRRPQVAQLAPIQAAFLRRNISEKIPESQKKVETKYGQEKIKPTPEIVSTTSSTHPIFSEVATETPVQEIDMMAGVKHDVVSKILCGMSTVVEFKN